MTNGRNQTRGDRRESRNYQFDPHRPRVAWITGLATLVLIAGLVGYGAVVHHERNVRAQQTLEREQNRVPTVRVKAAKRITEPKQIDLSGTMEAFESATIYARATGYIAERKVDIGSQVRAGDRLATIAAPDLDQQLAQARAQVTQLEAAVAQAHANSELARVTNERTSRLVGEGWQTLQQGDNDRLTFMAQSAALRVAEANLEQQKAQVARLEELTGFERVTAPFNGVITARQIDTGSLVTADTANGTALFSIARTNTLRVQVYVPQEVALGIRDGAQAEVRVPEMSGRVFHGSVARNASALQAGTRTLLTEVDIDNAEGTLHAGLYCTVRFSVPRSEQSIVVPSEAIIFNRTGLNVAIVDGNTVRLRQITLAADNGADLEVKQGLSEGDRIILSPPIDLADGKAVKPAEAE